MSRRTTTSSAGTSSRSRAASKALALLLGLVSVVGIGAAVGASAAVPVFPNNIVVFPDRDFVVIEGYQDHIGETATVQVTRNGAVMGSARAEVAAGDVAFEINHPGGACWGAGTGLDVTPDIKPGDKVTISFAGDGAGDTTVQDTHVTAVDYTPGSTTLLVRGNVGTGVVQAQMEQRVVNPDLVPTAVTRRDIRAVPGPLTPAPKGGYSSMLEFAGDTFTATYEFTDADTAAIAATGGGERAMAWQEEDADGNRQGITISELGEPGGPGMGGCPPGPTAQAPPRPGAAAAIRSADGTELQVRWSEATPAPGADAVTGYSIEAISENTSAAGDRAVIGRRTGASATMTTITGLTAGEVYSVEVRSLSGEALSAPYIVQQAPPSEPGPADTTAPAVTASPAGGTIGSPAEATSVTLSSDENADIYFTTDGSPALANGDLPSDTARLFTGPIAITELTTINFVAFDRAGNFGLGSGTFEPPAVVAPAAPALGASSAGQASVTLRWTATDPSITGYGVQLYNHTTGATVGALRETAEKSLTITGLTAGTAYSFTVKAKNAAGYGAASARSAPLTPTAVTDRVTITQARWKAGDFRVSGTGSSPGATVTVRSGSPTGTALGTAVVDAAGAWELRLRNAAAPAARPPTVYAVSNRGGVAGPTTVA